MGLRQVARVLVASASRLPGQGALATRTVTGATGATCTLFSAGTQAYLPQLQRSNSTRSLGWDITLPSRTGLFSDAATVMSLLPNRSLLAAQFSPHGIQLVPKVVLDARDTAPAPAPAQVSRHTNTNPSVPAPPPGRVAAAAPLVHQPVSDTTEEDGDDQPEGMKLVDMTRVWRRLKMKKHKIRKRRKANRYKAPVA